MDRAERILISLALLDTLASNARIAADAFRENSRFANLSFAPDHAVTKAFEDFIDQWDWKREKLQKQLDTVADAFHLARESFCTVDAELAKALRSDATQK